MVLSCRRDIGFVPVSEVRPPLLGGDDISLKEVKAFPAQFDECVERLWILNLDAMERRVASSREPLTMESIKLHRGDNASGDK